MSVIVSILPLVAEGSRIEILEPSPNRVIAAYKGGGATINKDVGSQANKDAVIQRTDQVFPHIAMGGGWETVMVLVNLSDEPVEFVQRFFDVSGNPMQVTFRSFPELQLITAAAARGRLNPHASFNFSLFDSTPDTRVGWSLLEYDSSKVRLGGYAAFRYKAGGVINEGLVPISSYTDSTFMMSFDNYEGFSTAIALCNPASNLGNRVTLIALDLAGREIARTIVTLGPSGQTSFELAERLPALKGQVGTLFVMSDITRLSAIGIRMNVAGGYTFTSVPIMNW